MEAERSYFQRAEAALARVRASTDLHERMQLLKEALRLHSLAIEEARSFAPKPPKPDPGYPKTRIG